MPATSSRQILLALFAGSAALVVVHALGRFAYTPLLPYLLDDGLLSLEQGARLATWNYVGYLIGALLALLRLPSGIRNCLVFVLAPALVLEWLSRRERASLSGLVYLGFAAGLLLTSWLAEAPAAFLHGAERWWPMAGLAVPLALLSCVLLLRLHIPPAPARANAAPPSRRLFARASTPLFLAYAAAGLGYILPMTFLPTLANQLLPPGDPLTGQVWLWTALACLI